MINTSEIIKTKIDSRCCRRKTKHINTVQSILEECCIELDVDVPELICCDTLAKNFGAFKLKDKSYIVFDNCLTESLYLFNAIILTGNYPNDVDKFFYKLFAEELILNNHLPKGLYFTGKYRDLTFSFEDQGLNEATKQVSYQIYFLLGHEITHLSLANNTLEISFEFKKLVNVAVKLLTRRFINEDRDEQRVLNEITGYFIKDRIFESIDEYVNYLSNDIHYNNFVEECFCDFQGFKLLLEHYSNAEFSIYSISNALNYLVLQESIRSDLANGALDVNNTSKDAQDTLYFSVLRIQMLLIILQMNEIETIGLVYDKTLDCCELTEQLGRFMEMLPDRNILNELNSNDLPNIDLKTIKDILIKQLFYSTTE